MGRVKELLGLKNRTKIETLEAGECNAIVLKSRLHCSSGEVKATLTLLWHSSAVKFLGLNVPERAAEPTEARPGRNRSERARNVSAHRRTITRLFEEMARSVGHQVHAKLKRELILEAGWCS